MTRRPRRVPDRIEDMLEAIANAESDAAVVWTTVRESLPSLKAQLIAFGSGGEPPAPPCKPS